MKGWERDGLAAVAQGAGQWAPRQLQPPTTQRSKLSSSLAASYHGETNNTTGLISPIRPIPIVDRNLSRPVVLVAWQTRK